MSERDDLIERVVHEAREWPHGQTLSDKEKDIAEIAALRALSVVIPIIAAQAATISRLEAEVEAAGQTTILPLEWVYVGDPCYRCKSKTLFGRYDVWKDDAGYTFSLSGKDCPQVYASEDEAKAAAQEDFASKARSLLVPPRTEGERG